MVAFFLMLIFSRSIAAEFPKINSVELGSPYISTSKMVGSWKATAFSIDCIIQGDASNEQLKVEITFLINKDVLTKFKEDYPVEKMPLSESYLRGKIGGNLTCEVVLESTDGTKSSAVTSPDYFLGVYVVDSNGVPINEVLINQGEKSSITLRSTFPFTTAHCIDVKYCTLTKAMFEIFHIKKGVVKTQCRLVFYALNDSLTYESSTVQIAALVTPGVEESVHLLEFRQYKSVFKNILIQNYLIPPIMVRVIDKNKRKSCHSTGDPHYLTFDDLTFDNYFVGDFEMLSTAHRTFQVQVRQVHCGASAVPPTCICGVVVREGNSILGVTSCDHKSNYVIVEIMKDNTNLPAIIQKENNRYVIKLISGIRVEAEPFTLMGKHFLNVYVFPLKREKYKGICTLDKAPTDFNEFRISSDESFFQKKLPPCVNEVFNYPSCKCTSTSSGNITVVCGFEDESEYKEIIKLTNVCNTKNAPKVKRNVDPNNPEMNIPLLDVNTGAAITLADIFGDIDRRTSMNVTQPTDVTRLIDEKVAEEECKVKLKSSQFYEQCSSVVDPTTYQTLLRNCIDDVGFSGSYDVIGSIIRTYESVCNIKASKEVEIVNGSVTEKSHKYVVMTNNIETLSCPACANNGTCENGVCKCVQGFSGKNCAYISGKAPEIKFVRNISSCDVLADECNLINLEIYANPEVEQSMKCIAEVLLEDGIRENLTMGEKSIQPGLFQCTPDKQSFERTRQERSKMNVKIYTIVQAEGKELKSNEIDLSVYDSTCLSCLNEGCPQKKNTCLINKRCYKAGYAKEENLVCDPSISSTEWSQAKISKEETKDPIAVKPQTSMITAKKIETTTKVVKVAETRAVEASNGMVRSLGWVIAVPIIVRVF